MTLLGGRLKWLPSPQRSKTDSRRDTGYNRVVITNFPSYYPHDLTTTHGHPPMYTYDPNDHPVVLSVLSSCCHPCLLPFVPTIDWICCVPLLHFFTLFSPYVVLVTVAFLGRPVRSVRCLTPPSVVTSS